MLQGLVLQRLVIARGCSRIFSTRKYADSTTLA